MFSSMNGLLLLLLFYRFLRMEWSEVHVWYTKFNGCWKKKWIQFYLPCNVCMRKMLISTTIKCNKIYSVLNQMIHDTQLASPTMAQVH